RQFADFNDPVIDRCGRGRTPFFLNGMAADPRFSELLYASATDRLLAAPLYLRGQLVGAIDMRDKASKQPFEQTDVAKAQAIADRIANLFTSKNVFGQRFIALSDVDEPAAAREILRAILMIPGAVVAAFSAYGHMGGVQEIASKSTLTDDASTMLQSKLNIWLTRRGEAGGYVRTAVQTPLGTSGPPINGS